MGFFIKATLNISNDCRQRKTEISAQNLLKKDYNVKRRAQRTVEQMVFFFTMNLRKIVSIFLKLRFTILSDPHQLNATATFFLT